MAARPGRSIASPTLSCVFGAQSAGLSHKSIDHRSSLVFVALAELLMRRPEQRLGDDNAVAIERHAGAAVELVAQLKSLAHTPAEGVIIRPGQDSVGRQALGRWGWHRAMISRVCRLN